VALEASLVVVASSLALEEASLVVAS
jgi:hypothetical protein